MYLENDFYLNDYKPQINNDKEAYAFIKQSFPTLELKPVKGSYLTAVLCLYIYIGYCASPYELSALFGPFFTSASVRTRFAELTRKKCRVFGALSWANNDMGAQRAYHITKQGYESYLSSILDVLKPLRGGIKVRRSGGLVPAHDYGVGLSVYSFLLTGIPFYYEKEEIYSSSSIIKQKGGLCVDCTLYMPHGNYKIYLEQDMGNETASTLINKIGTYQRLGLASADDSCLLFSSHSIMPMPSCPSFSPIALEAILQDMETSNSESIYSYFTANENRLDSKTLKALKKLLVRTGVCDAFSDTGTPLPLSSVDEASVMRRHTIRIFARKIETGSRLSDDFTIDELRRYVYELKAGCNPYRLKCYNFEQYRIAKNKFHNMCTILTNYVSEGKYERDELLCLLGGYACYMLPSVLLSKTAPLFNPDTHAFIDKCRNALSDYYPGIDTADYSGLSKPFYFDEYALVIFRNTYTLPSGRMVCFEHIGKDIGAFVRCFYIILMSSLCPMLDLHIVAICDDDSDMLFFCNRARYSITYSRFPEKGKGVYLSFLMETELSSDCCLLKGIDNLEEPVPMYIRTKKQADELLQFNKSLNHNGSSVPPRD